MSDYEDEVEDQIQDDEDQDQIEDQLEESITEFPMLFHEAKKRKWMIRVEGNIIYRNDGLSSKDFVKKPSVRVVDAKRDTTPEGQAILEARKYWVKMLDKGYMPSPEDEGGMSMYDEMISIKKKQGGNNHGTSSGKPSVNSTKSKSSSKRSSDKTSEEEPSGFSSLDEGSIKRFPMLALKYEDKASRVIWESDAREKIVRKVGQERFDREYFDATDGCFVNPKLDGLHCIAYINGDDVILSSRQGKQFVFLNHVRSAVKTFIGGRENVSLVGELYVHSPRIQGKVLDGNDRFSYISSACKTNRKTPHTDERQIQFHIFDTHDHEDPLMSQTDRLQRIKKLFSKSKGTDKVLVPVKVTVIRSPDEIMKQMDDFLSEGYEGIILRNPSGVYEGKRSLHLLKHKKFDDAEYTIVGAKAAKGTAEGAVIWELQTHDGSDTFTCSMTGDLEMRREMYENYTDYLGKDLNVKYQGLSKDGIPRFPRGIYIRDKDV